MFESWSAGCLSNPGWLAETQVRCSQCKSTGDDLVPVTRDALAPGAALARQQRGNQ